MATTTFKHQVIFYFICGAISTSFDFIIYFTLYKLGAQLDIAKGFSFIIATFISYFLNKRLTFKTQRKSFMEFTNFVAVHVFTMLIDVGANRLFIFLLGYFILGHIKIILAFILATSCSIIINFTGQKFWVFRIPKPHK